VVTNVRAILADIQYYAKLAGFDFGDLGPRLAPLFEAMSEQVSDRLIIDDNSLSITLAIELFFANPENYYLIHQVLDLRDPALLISAKDFIETVFKEVVLNPKVQEEAEAEARRMSSTGGDNELNAGNSYTDLTFLKEVGVVFQPTTTVFEQVISEEKEAAPQIHVSRVLSHLGQLQDDLLEEKLFSQEEASKFVSLVLKILDFRSVSPVLNKLKPPNYYLDERSFNSKVETALDMFQIKFGIQLQPEQLEKIRKVCSDFFKEIASQN